MIDAMTCRELPAAAMGPPSRSAEALSRDDEAGAILLSNCREDVRSENIFDCRANIVANGPHKRADQIRAKPNESKVGEVSPSENNQVIFCSKLPMLQQEA